MLNTSIFFKFFTFLIILALFFFAFSYVEKEAAERKFNLFLSNFLKANPEVKNITYSNLNTNLIWALEGKYEISNLIINLQNPLYNLQVGRLKIKQVRVKDMILFSHSNASELVGFEAGISDVFFKNLSKMSPDLPSNLDLFLNISLRYFVDEKTQKQRLAIDIHTHQELTDLQARVYTYSSPLTEKNRVLLPLTVNDVKLAGNRLLKIFDLANPNTIKITNNPKLRQNNIAQISASSKPNIIEKIYIQTLIKQIKNLDQLDKNLKIIHDSTAYQAALAYLLGDQSQTLITPPS